MKNVVILTVVILTLLFLIFFGPSLFMALWMEFNPNNYKTEEVGAKVKETLQEKYGEKFVVDKTEYNAGLNGFISKVYPEKKLYLNFEAYVPGNAIGVYEDYQIKKKLDNYLNKRFSLLQYYYEISSGRQYEKIPEDIKNEELGVIQLFVITVEDKVDAEESLLQLDELTVELKNEGVTSFELTFMVVKKPYTLERLEKSIFQKSFLGFLEDQQSTAEFVLKCEYSSWENVLPFSSTCKKFN